MRRVTNFASWRSRLEAATHAASATVVGSWSGTPLNRITRGAHARGRGLVARFRLGEAENARASATGGTPS